VTRARLLAICGLAAAALAAACGSSGALKSPKSDSQYDDGDDPGTPGSSGGAPDASGDAQGRFCIGDRDCPASHHCVFPISGGCTAAGACMLYTTATGCDQSFACGCSGKNVTLCAPAGFASAPASASGPCSGDASLPDTSTVADATSD
jgi:hypothetical protein